MSHFQVPDGNLFYAGSDERSVEGASGRGGGRERRAKKSRRRRTDRAGSSNKEWRYKNALQQRLTTGCANLQTYEEKTSGAQSSSPLRQLLHGRHHSVMKITKQVCGVSFQSN